MRRLFAAVASTMFVDSLLYLAVIPLLPWYADQFDLSKTQVAFLLAGYPLAFLIVTTPAGWLAGRVGPKRVVIAGTLAYIGATFLFAWAPSAEAIILARLIQGIGGGVGWAAAMAWLTGNVEPARRSRAIGSISGVLSAGAVAGPALGALAGATSTALAFGLAGGLAIVALTLTILAPAGQPLPADPPLHTTLGRLIRHPLVLCALGFSLADAAGVAAVDLLAPLQLGAMGIGTTAIGIAIGTGAALGVVAGWLAGRVGERVGSFRVALVGGVGLGVMPVILIAPGLPAWAILGVLVAIGPFFPILMTGVFPLMSAAADDLGLSHGTGNALANMVWSGGFAVFPLVFAPIAEAAGDSIAYALAAVVVVLLLGTAVLMREKARKLALSH